MFKKVIAFFKKATITIPNKTWTGTKFKKDKPRIKFTWPWPGKK